MKPSHEFLSNIAHLIDVKTIVTFLVVGGYVAMTIMGQTVPDSFSNLTMIIVAFYFGTQFQKSSDTTPSSSAPKRIGQ